MEKRKDRLTSKKTEVEFLKTWNHVERYYKKHYPKVLDIISYFRVNGFDSQIRAGTSIYNLIISRSENYGLRAEQAYIVFDLEKIILGKYELETLKKLLDFSQEKYKKEILPSKENYGKTIIKIKNRIEYLEDVLLEEEFFVKVYINKNKYQFNNKIETFNMELNRAILLLLNENID